MLAALFAFIVWGLAPLYFRALDGVPPFEIVAHRVLWSALFLAGLLAFMPFTGGFARVRSVWQQPRLLALLALTSLLTSSNWLVFIWSIDAGRLLEASLGYFINPLVSVLLGFIVLKEKLRGAQWVALSIALVGVLYLTFSYGAFPWIALTLAFTFAFYGLIRKTALLNSAEGLFLETAVLFLPALGFLILQEMRGTGAFGHASMTINLLLAGAGIVTSIPLLLFAAGARRITLTSLGLLQYIMPTLQFLIGVLIYHEGFGPSRIVGFGLIWLALILYTVESLFHRKQAQAVQAPVEIAP